MNNEPTCIELEQMTAPQLRELRAQYKLDEEQFAKKFNVSVEQLREWESQQVFPV